MQSVARCIINSEQLLSHQWCGITIIYLYITISIWIHCLRIAMFSGIGLSLHILMFTSAWASPVAWLWIVRSISFTTRSLGALAPVKRLIRELTRCYVIFFWIIDGPLVYHLFLRIKIREHIIYTFDINFTIDNICTYYLDTYSEQPELRALAAAPRTAALMPTLQKYFKYIIQHWYF